ncbi:ATP-binding protein [Streptacidiphilus sp. P02-A3a]|uniref:ATP-binding protein n=1 Tax=Streptacidiphilus sp. P02-A3a TaxID=2704468 RepID=UPI0015FA5B49|nr:ATP-binding protein [Streptacidiphilus sp. P02-A3a]QMU67120.1 ATP-binding protein [Streptacidiphilus sp. P02-A3a]
MSRETTMGSGVVITYASVCQHFLDPPSFRCQLAVGLSAAPTARSLLRERLTGYVPPDTLADADLVLTELIANAVNASPVSALVGLLVHLVEPSLLISVFDESTGAPRPRCPDPLELDEGGRGLLLVAELSQTWGWHAIATGKVVWAVLSLL